jgi:cytoskeleton protein RodZ
MDEIEESVSLGERLREAREAKGISVENVANQLRISPATINTIEADAYDCRGADAVFMRGYIRSYAKLVGLTDEEIGVELQHLSSTAKVKPTDKNTQIKIKQASLKDKHVRFITYFIIALLVILVLVWWYLHYTETNQPINIPNSTTIQTGTAGNQPAVNNGAPISNAQSEATQVTNDTQNMQQNVKQNDAKSPTTNNQNAGAWVDPDTVK